MFLLQQPHFPLHLPVSQLARGGRLHWEIIVMKSEAVTFNEAVFVWNTHPGSRAEHLLADVVLASPGVTVPRKRYLPEVEGRRILLLLLTLVSRL